MRPNIDSQKIERLMQVLGREAQGSGCVYFTDVQAMYEQNLFSLEALRDSFEAIAPELIRFPALDPDVIRSRVERFIECSESDLAEGQP